MSGAYHDAEGSATTIGPTAAGVDHSPVMSSPIRFISSPPLSCPSSPPKSPFSMYGDVCADNPPLVMSDEATSVRLINVNVSPAGSVSDLSPAIQPSPPHYVVMPMLLLVILSLM